MIDWLFLKTEDCSVAIQNRSFVKCEHETWQDNSWQNVKQSD